jgi:hypothetical protein
MWRRPTRRSCTRQSRARSQVEQIEANSGGPDYGQTALRGSAEKRVPISPGRPGTVRPADGGQGHFLNGRYSGCITTQGFWGNPSPIGLRGRRLCRQTDARFRVIDKFRGVSAPSTFRPGIKCRGDRHLRNLRQLENYRGVVDPRAKWNWPTNLNWLASGEVSQGKAPAEQRTVARLP